MKHKRTWWHVAETLKFYLFHNFTNEKRESLQIGRTKQLVMSKVIKEMA
jgi:hypothetical protein